MNLNDKQGENEPGQETPYRFGKLGSYKMQYRRYVVGILEAKHNGIDVLDFGELFDYHAWAGGECWGMLFDYKQFWLYESMHGHPYKLIKGTWVAGGSKKAIADFFSKLPEPRLLTVMRKLLKDLNANIIHLDGKCWSGSGGFGYVFTVKKGNDIHALKIVENTDG